MGRSRLGWVALGALAVGGCVTPPEEPEHPPLDRTPSPAPALSCGASVPGGPELATPLGIQLHAHGLSNHGSSSRPNSMQFASVQARRIGLGAVWWSEHLPMYNQHDSVLIRPARGTVDPDSLHVTGLSGDATRLGASVAGNGAVSAAISDSALVMYVSGGSPSTPARLTYTTQHLWIDHRWRWPETLRFNRPVSSRAQVVVNYRLCGASPTPLHVLVRLSWHVEESGAERPQVLHYVLAPEADSSSRVPEGPAALRVVVPVAPEGQVVLDLLPDASLLPDGDDNTVVDISWYLEATDATLRCAAVSRVLLRSASPAMAANWGESRRLAERYRARYGLEEFIGFEGWVPFPELVAAGLGLGRAGEHLNAFLPTADEGVPSQFVRLGGEAFTQRAHDLCGVAAINHPFGYGFVIADSAERLRVRRQVIEFLRVHRGLGADLMEVGLPRRGDFLDGHLLLWDVLNAQGIRMCGIGTSDSHGWRWDDPTSGRFTENRNPFVTWLWVRAPSQDQVVSALRRCRAYFGDPFVFPGTIDLRALGSPVMGSTLEMSADSTAIDVVILPSGFNFWLIQGTAGGKGVIYLRREQLPAGVSRVRVETRRSSFVRVEAWTPTGRPAAFSNPVWLSVDSARGVRPFLRTGAPQ